MNWKTKLYSINRVMLSVTCLMAFVSCTSSVEKSEKISSIPYYEEASFTPKWLASDSEDLIGFHQIPAFSFTNQNGEKITEDSFNDKIYVADFFFTTCPGICPKMTANMSIIQDAFINDPEVLLLSHSVTPEIDSVSVLKEYAKSKGVQSQKWHLITGKKSDIYSLGRNSYFVEEDLGEVKTDDDFLHTENFVLIDKDKHIRGIYNGLNKTSVQQLINDIKQLQLEERESNVINKEDQLF